MRMYSKCGKHETRYPHTCWCHVCEGEASKRRWNAKSLQEQRATWLKSKYHMTWDDYESMFITQDSQCAVCSRDPILLAAKKGQYGAQVDHNHETGEVRGLLCSPCNRALGLLGDSAHVIVQLLNYRRSYD
jgi:hypothetical protein